MQFEEGFLYRIYNQGNNRQKIFFNKENYMFFLKKIKTHITPYADILAWCLMPNHFHFMVLVNKITRTTDSITPSHRISHGKTHGVALSDAVSKQGKEPGDILDEKGQPTASLRATPLVSPKKEKRRTFNDSIGIMLRSYTNAINKQQNRSGKLFREATNAECLNCPKSITPSFITKNGITEIKTGDTEKEYPQICFSYIHQNPVKAGLAIKATDWEFSSARDYAGLRDGKLVNKKIAEELGLI
ncbi:MAG: hypothetical protein R6V23_12695 [Bacteroidales bacterium]